MRELKEDFLINALCLIFDVTLKGGLYTGQMKPTTLYEKLLEDIIEI